MKIGLIGFGGMGKVVHRIALERGHEVPVIVDSGSADGGCARRHDGNAADTSPGTSFVNSLEVDVLRGLDVVIDFSSGQAVKENLAACIAAGVNLVVGTTGWYEEMAEVKKIVEGGGQSMIGFLWSSNFSIGVNMYFKIVAEAARLIDKFDEYDVWGHEIHHCNKADSPSGTAKTLEKILLENISRKTAVVEDKLDRRREPQEIHFSSVRGGLVNFGHTIGFDSAADRILITHEARCRDGYALGAVKAAEWLASGGVGGKVGRSGFFGMEDFMQD